VKRKRLGEKCMDNRYNRHNRRKYSLKVHIVLVTKYRKQLLKGCIADDVKQKIFDICNTNQWEIVAMETDKDHIHFLICYDTTNVIDDKIVSSCVCVIIPNLTREARPYALLENVVTHVDYRGKGFATECLNYAKNLAANENCYKIMLLTGSKDKKIIDFYRSAGYNSADKTAFVQWLNKNTNHRE
jgi:N-acetylglutamate synthase-like GNAT family acetyltransferase